MHVASSLGSEQAPHVPAWQSPAPPLSTHAAPSGPHAAASPSLLEESPAEVSPLASCNPLLLAASWLPSTEPLRAVSPLASLGPLLVPLPDPLDVLPSLPPSSPRGTVAVLPVHPARAPPAQAAVLTHAPTSHRWAARSDGRRVRSIPLFR